MAIFDIHIQILIFFFSSSFMVSSSSLASFEVAEKRIYDIEGHDLDGDGAPLPTPKSLLKEPFVSYSELVSFSIFLFLTKFFFCQIPNFVMVYFSVFSTLSRWRCFWFLKRRIGFYKQLMLIWNGNFGSVPFRSFLIFIDCITVIGCFWGNWKLAWIIKRWWFLLF